MQIDESFHSIEHIENTGTVSAEIKKATLLERAKKISEIKEQDSVDKSYTEVVIFGLGDEQYAIETKYIKEVYPLNDVTTIPCVPCWIYGVINVRRKIYSVVDLKVFFGLVQQADYHESKVIILEDGNYTFGILADHIYEVKSIITDSLQFQLPTLSHQFKEYLKGITTDRIIVLNGKKLLHSESLIVDEVVN